MEVKPQKRKRPMSILSSFAPSAHFVAIPSADEPCDVLSLLLAEAALLVRLDPVHGDQNALRASDAPQGVQGGESRHRSPHSPLPEKQRDPHGRGFRRGRSGAGADPRPGELPRAALPRTRGRNLSKANLSPPNSAGGRLLVFILDATWSGARKMLKLSPSLQRLPRVMFTPTAPSRYVIKQQPQDGCLSTLEACHELLLSLENQASTVIRCPNNCWEFSTHAGPPNPLRVRSGQSRVSKKAIQRTEATSQAHRHQRRKADQISAQPRW